LRQKKVIEEWLSSIEKYVIEKLENNETFNGWKLVAGRSNRKWADELDAEKKLKRLLGVKKAYTKKLLSVAQAEKALGKEKTKIENMIVRPEGKHVLVPEEDARPAIAIGITADDF
jgi:hypothetical protein